MPDQARLQNRGAESRAVVLEIDDRQENSCGVMPKLSTKWGSTMFEPNGRTGLAIDGRPSSSSFASPSVLQPAGDAPEKRLTLFALRLAVLEKAASSLGTLGFIWATVVLLGGFAITLDTVDFWVVTTILVIEGARIFSRSHELEWQHQATRSLDVPTSSRTPQRILRSLTSRLHGRSTRQVGTASSSSFRTETEDHMGYEQQLRPGGCSSQPADDVTAPARRAWKSSEVPIVPYAGWVLDSARVSRILYWLQLVSASTCVALSLARLSQQSFGELQKGDADKRNRKAALNIFYGLALAEALLFLVEKSYWELEIGPRKLLATVSRECRLGDSPSDLAAIRRFFYDAFSRCINGSVFDGAKMELVSFGEELLGSDSRDEQLIGARILCRLAVSDEFGRDTLRKIGTSAATMERLVEMLNWKSSSETELRQYAAEVVAKLASKNQNVLRVAGIPGSMESIASLLSYSTTGTVPRPHEVRVSGSADNGQRHYDHMHFNLLGLKILKRLAHNHDNCGKIGNTRGLLPRIINFTAAEWLFLLPERSDDSRDKEARAKAAKRSLQLLKMLANATGSTGKLLRREIADIVFTVGNMRDIVRCGREYKLLQRLAVEIITCLALDTEARGQIGGTGGVIRDLFQVFFANEGRCTDPQQHDLGLEAGEALAMLALESQDNCRRMLGLGAVSKLVGALRIPDWRVSAGRILTNLCAYSGSDSSRLLRGITEAASTVLQAIMTDEKKPLEVSAGLALHVFRLMSREETEEAFREAGIHKTDLAERLIHILRSYSQPSVKEPRIRKYVVELVIWMMMQSAANDDGETCIIAAFKTGGVVEHLQNVAETTSELELYNVFSGSAGLSRHETAIESLVETAMVLLTGTENLEAN